MNIIDPDFLIFMNTIDADAGSMLAWAVIIVVLALWIWRTA